VSELAEPMLDLLQSFNSSCSLVHTLFLCAPQVLTQQTFAKERPHMNNLSQARPLSTLRARCSPSQLPANDAGARLLKQQKGTELSQGRICCDAVRESVVLHTHNTVVWTCGVTHMGASHAGMRNLPQHTGHVHTGVTSIDEHNPALLECSARLCASRSDMVVRVRTKALPATLVH
jgi:hypothetical protein